jgi:hypothetical protein
MKRQSNLQHPLPLSEDEAATLQLFSAAPEMLDALRELAAAYFPNADWTAEKQGEESLHSAVRKARAAIRKATAKP